MSDPNDLIVKFHIEGLHPKLGDVVGENGKVRCYPFQGAQPELICVSLTNNEDDRAGESWTNCKSVILTKPQAVAFVHAIMEAIRDME